jgi:hypothetical protein
MAAQLAASREGLEDRPGCGIIVWLHTDATTDAGHKTILALIDGSEVGTVGGSVLVWIW